MHARAAAVAEEMPEAEVKNRETKRKLTPVELRDRIAAVAGEMINARINQPTTEFQPQIPELRFRVLPLPHDYMPILSGNVLIINQSPPVSATKLTTFALEGSTTKLGISRRPFRSIATELFDSEQTLQALYDFLKTTDVENLLIVLEPNADEITWQDSEIVSVTKTVSQAVSSPVSPDQQR